MLSCEDKSEVSWRIIESDSTGLSGSRVYFGGINGISHPFEKPITGVPDARDSSAVSQKVSRNREGINK